MVLLTKTEEGEVPLKEKKSNTSEETVRRCYTLTLLLRMRES